MKIKIKNQKRERGERERERERSSELSYGHSPTCKTYKNLTLQHKNRAIVSLVMETTLPGHINACGPKGRLLFLEVLASVPYCRQMLHLPKKSQNFKDKLKEQISYSSYWEAFYRLGLTKCQ